MLTSAINHPERAIAVQGLFPLAVSKKKSPARHSEFDRANTSRHSLGIIASEFHVIDSLDEIIDLNDFNIWQNPVTKYADPLN